MKNATPRLAAAIAALLSLPLCQAYSAEYSAGRLAPAAIQGLSLPAAPSLNSNPAPLSGVSAFGVTLPATPLLAAPAQLPLLPQSVAAPLAPQAKAPEAAVPGGPRAQAVLQALGAGVQASSNKDGQSGGAGEQRSLGAAFDGAKVSASAVDAGTPAGPSGPGGNDGSGNNGGNGNDNGGSRKGDDGSLGRLYPRAVMILDTLDGPASDKLVHQIETLADAGVRVVFVTPRADKGDDSADSVLISKLKRRTGNPVVVVSYNGARVTAHNSKAEHPKPLVEDLEGFPQNAVQSFSKIGKAALVKAGVKGDIKEFGVPSLEEAHIYGGELPAGVELKAFVSSFNNFLRNRGMKYKVEGVAGPDGRNYFFTQSTALKLNASRIFNALYAQNPDLRGSLQREQVLVLADSTKAANFLKALSQTEDVPGKGFYIHGVKDAASTETALDALLGNAALEKVSVMRSQLRSYSEWLDARARWGAPRQGGGGSGFDATSKARTGRYYRDLGFFRGIIMYDLMGRLYHLLRKGQYMEASPEAAADLLDRMWRNPRANGVRISDEMDASLRNMRKTAWGRQMMNGYLDTARTWLRNYYKRNLPNFPSGVSEKVVGTMINLARDSKNSVTLEYASPYTGRRYMVHALPARAHLERDDKGNLLVAHVYRTGKEPYESEFEDSIETNLMGAVMLAGYGENRGGTWYVNDEANPRVKVVFHYMTRDLSRIMTPEQLEQQGQEVTTLIEKMQADTEFQEHWAEQEEQNNKMSSGAAKAKAAAEKRASAPKPGKKKASKSGGK